MNPTQNNKIHLNKAPIMGYILTAVVGSVYLVYYDVRFGLSFMTVLLLAPLISYLFIQSSLNEISVDVLLSHKTAYKSEIITMTVTIKSGSAFPVPFFYLELFNEGNLSCLDTNKYLLSLSSETSSVVTQSYKAEIWGSALLGIKDIAMYDYLGLFKIEISPANSDTILKQTVEICPAINESQTNDLMAIICNEIICEENEETDQNIQHSIVSEPGYEHRPYIPGDPLKRINWKLSAKIDKYMVREYEPLGTETPVILLDRFGLQSHFLPEDQQKSALLSEERIVEAVLAMLTSMCLQNIACKVYCFFDDKWQEFLIEGNGDVSALQYAFVKYKFAVPFNAVDKTRIPMDIINKNKNKISLMMFTCALDASLRDELEDARDTGVIANVVCPDTTRTFCENMWAVNEAYDFYSIDGGNYD